MLSLKCVGIATVLVISAALEPLCNVQGGCPAPQRAHGPSLLQVVATRTRTQVNRTQRLPEASQQLPLQSETVGPAADPSLLALPTPGTSLLGLEYLPQLPQLQGKRVLEAATMVVLLALSVAAIYLWVEKRYRGDDAQRGAQTMDDVPTDTRPLGREAAAPDSPFHAGHEQRSLMGEEVQSVSCDYVMVLATPVSEDLRPSSNSSMNEQSTSGIVEHMSARIGEVRNTTHQIARLWQANMVPGLEHAKTVFLDPLRHHFMSEQILRDRFSEEMSFESYAEEVRKLLAEMLTSSAFGCELEEFRTSDKDKLYWRLRLPCGDPAAQYAAHYHYRMHLNDAAYEKVHLDVPRNESGDKVYAVMPYMQRWAELFREFRQIDRLKLMYMRMDRWVNLHALKKQNVLIQMFAAHNLEQVNFLCKKWANVRRWYRFPKFQHMEDVREYFGERIAFLFVWQRYYMNALLVPAILGGIVFWRRFVLPESWHNLVEIGFAMVMAFWAPIFNARYARFEARTRQRWGMNDDPGFRITNMQQNYNPKLENTWQVALAPILGDILGLCIVFLSVVGVQVIQNYRSTSTKNFESWHGLFVALQIICLDWIWLIISKYIVHLENHRLTTSWWDSWIQKMLPVRIFTNLSPFIFVGFLKQHTAEGCPSTQRGCLDELQMDLCIYFAMTISKDIARDVLLIAYAYVKLALYRRRRRHDGDSEEQKYMFLQVQAQMYSYDDWHFMDDWTRQVTTFLLLVCFNVVLPAIGVFVLLTTMFEARLLAHRTCCHLQRPVPAGAAGIGAWQSVLEIMEVIGVLVQVSFAIFVMHPLAEKPLWDKFFLFLISEHVLLVHILFIKGKFPRTPHDVQDIAGVNDTMVNRHFIDVSANVVNIETRRDSRAIPAEGG